MLVRSKLSPRMVCGFDLLDQYLFPWNTGSDFPLSIHGNRFDGMDLWGPLLD